MSGQSEPQTQTIPIENKMDGRRVTVAAIGDLHVDESMRGAYVDLFAHAGREADVLVVAGDMTTHGRPEQMRAFVDELRGVEIPIVAVYGNHDYEGETIVESTAILHDRGIHVLDGDHIVVDGIGFAGIKGFAGGFGRGSLAPFGEALIKNFVQAAIDDALSLENALRSLQTELKIAVLHYAPIPDTIKGEPEVIYPFLGSSRLLQPLETYGADVIFHGHAHHGTLEGHTPSGIPVYNVAKQVLEANGMEIFLWRAQAPERRKR